MVFWDTLVSIKKIHLDCSAVGFAPHEILTKSPLFYLKIFRPMNNQIKIIGIVIGCFLSSISYGQQVKKFVYGGNKGTKFKGTIAISYYIENNGRLQKLADSTQVIDLNTYKEFPKLVVQLSSLRLGLNDTFHQTRNSNHPDVFFIEAWNTSSSRQPLAALTTDSLRLGAKKKGLGRTVVNFAYQIKNPNKKTGVQVKLQTQTFDGVYPRQWKGITISKTFVIVPKIIVPEDPVAVVENSTQKRTTSNSSYRRNRSYRNVDYRNKNQVNKDTLTIEDHLWKKIEQDQISGNKDNLATRCRLYQMNCKQGIFKDCKYSEEVLFFLLGVVSSEEQLMLVDTYKKTYPEGKFIMHLPKPLASEKPELVPIKKDYAQLDFDENALLVNRVEGGNKPYFIGFYDYNKNKKLAVKTHRFTKGDLSVSLDALGIPQGMYMVKVMDSKGQLFVEKSKIFIKEPITISKSIKLSGLLLLLGGLGLLYKKHIHF